MVGAEAATVEEAAAAAGAAVAATESMSLQELQALTARLYTDDVFRADFFRSADSDVERSLGALDRQRVELYAHGLKRKRLQLVRQWIPATGTARASTLPPAASPRPPPGACA